MSIWSALRILKRRWWLIAFVTGLVTGVVWYYYWSQPQEWEGFATVAEYRTLIPNRTIIYPDPTTLQVDLITRLQNLANVLSSFTVLSRTWSELKDSNRWAPAEEIKKKYADPVEQDIAGFIDLSDRLTVKPVPNTEYITVAIRVMGDSQQARDQALYATEVLMRKFEEHYTTLNERVAEPSRIFIEQQLAHARREYERAARNVAEFQNRYRELIQPTDQTSATLVNINQYEMMLNDAIRTQRLAAIRVARLAQQLRQEQVETGRYMEVGRMTRMNPIYQQLLASKITLETQLQSLLAQGKGEKHPAVEALRAQLKDVEKQLGQVQKEIVDAKSTGMNPVHELLLREYVLAQTDLAVSNARIKQIEPQLAQLRAKLNNYPDRARQLQDLLLQRSLAEEKVILLKRKLDEAIIREQELRDAQFIKLIDAPSVRPVDNKLGLRVTLAFALSLILSVGLILLLSQIDQGVYTLVQAENLLGAPVIAALPRLKQQLLSRDQADISALSASYQVLSTNLMGFNGRLQGPAVVIASAEPNVGRSTVALNLAITLARDGARVVLVDADLRQPSLHRLLRLENRAGLSEVLSGELEPEQVVQMTPIEGMVFISAGTPPANPIRLLRSPRTQVFIEKVSKVADFLIFDTPAGLTFADSGVIGMFAKNVLIVHAAGTPASEAYQEFLRRLQHLGVNIVGVVLNKVRPDDSYGYLYFQRAYRHTLALRDGYTAVPRPALPAGSEIEAEQTTPKEE